jgi:hypothetical protein
MRQKRQCPTFLGLSGSGGSAMPDTLYDEDFFIWTERQAAALRRAAREGSNLPLDFENLAEEIEGLGRRDRREAGSLVKAILVHLIKLSSSPARAPRQKWQAETDRFRFALSQILDDSPSLRAHLPEMIAKMGPRALTEARAELHKYGERATAEAALARWKDWRTSEEDVLSEGHYPAPDAREAAKAQ